jgi:DNA-directed RNA polymerase subunit RPC12/RpoP
MLALSQYATAGAEVMDPDATPICPECGFRVFNRRYPKCESCGAILPESIVYTPVERQILRVADEERALEKARNEKSTGDTIHSSIDDSLMSAVMGLTGS